MKNWNDLSDDQKKTWVEEQLKIAFRLAVKSRQGDPRESVNQPLNIFWYILKNSFQLPTSINTFPKFLKQNSWISGKMGMAKMRSKPPIDIGDVWDVDPVFITIENPVLENSTEQLQSNNAKAVLNTDKTIIISLIVIAVIIAGVIIFKRYKNG
jgi:hypothetical protein